MTDKKTTKKSVKKPAKKAPSKKEIADLEKKYKGLFMDVVNVIKKEKNVAVVYQVLVDILMQIESQVKQSKHQHDSGCGPDECGSCSECK